MSEKSLETSVSAFNAALRGLRAATDALEDRMTAPNDDDPEQLRAALEKAREDQQREAALRKELAVKLDVAISRLRAALNERDGERED